MKFLSRYEYECPSCHGKLDDEVIDGIEKKVCRSEKCRATYGDKGQIWDSAEV